MRGANERSALIAASSFCRVLLARICTARKVDCKTCGGSDRLISSALALNLPGRKGC